MNIAAKRLSRSARLKPQDKNEQYTPLPIVEFARAVMGGIELDPASNHIANQVVNADRFYTKEMNALALNWQAKTLWLNPPYGRGIIADFVWKLIEQSPSIGQAMVVVNSSTCASWYQALLHHCDRALFPGRRIEFWNAETAATLSLDELPEYWRNPAGGNERDQTIFYFGSSTDRFDLLAPSIGISVEPKFPGK